MAGIRCFVGLGNPGPTYAKTRHNVGQWWLDALATRCNTQFALQASLKSQVARFSEKENTCWLIKPTTYMNLSGHSVRAFTQFYKIATETLLIAHDDIDLPLGTIRLKFDGGHGGHNGLRSIIADLGTAAFYRLRIGVGHPGHADAVADHVLDRISAADTTTLRLVIDKGLSIVEELLSGNMDRAMKTLHTKEDNR